MRFAKHCRLLYVVVVKWAIPKIYNNKMAKSPDKIRLDPYLLEITHAVAINWNYAYFRPANVVHFNMRENNILCHSHNTNKSRMMIAHSFWVYLFWFCQLSSVSDHSWNFLQNWLNSRENYTHTHLECDRMTMSAFAHEHNKLDYVVLCTFRLFFFVDQPQRTMITWSHNTRQETTDTYFFFVLFCLLYLFAFFLFVPPNSPRFFDLFLFQCDKHKVHVCCKCLFLAITTRWRARCDEIQRDRALDEMQQKSYIVAGRRALCNDHTSHRLSIFSMIETINKIHWMAVRVVHNVSQNYSHSALFMFQMNIE